MSNGFNLDAFADAFGAELASRQALLCGAIAFFYAIMSFRCYKLRPHHEWRSNKVPVDEVKKLTFVTDKRDFLFGLADNQKPKAKMVYSKQDFGDYVCMMLLSWLACGLAYGFGHVFTKFVTVAAVFLIATFSVRHGVQFRDAPLLLSRPWSSFSHLLKYKWDNMRLAYFAQVSLCLAEAALFSSGVIQSLQVYPTLKSTLTSKVSEKWLAWGLWSCTLGAFYLHLVVLTTFRLLTFLAHVWSHQHVFTFLSQTGWKKVLSFIPRSSKDNNSILFRLEETVDHFIGLLHALITGIWTHLVTVIPWYFCLELSISSARSDPVVSVLLVISWLLRFVLLEQKINQDFEDNELNDWYIRDHWLGHHDRFEFNYMHGPHHDALPVGMIAVADNGPVEGLIRHSLGHFDSFACPPYALFRWTKTVIRDIVGHQYVPGVFPWSFMTVEVGVHHVEHHYLSMYPLGNGIESDPDPRNNCEVETWLSGDRYSADNKVWLWFVGQVVRLESKFLDKKTADEWLAKSKSGENCWTENIPEGNSKKDS